MSTCACGCGLRTELARRTRTTVSGARHIAGQPKPFYGNHRRNNRIIAGCFTVRSNGRWAVRTRDGRFEYWYRIVARHLIGRDLRRDEDVHHINGDAADDRPENLRVLSRSEHSTITGLERWAKVA